jgi:hypothetical membrane protein
MVQAKPETDTTEGRRLLLAGLAAPVVLAVAVVVAGRFEPGYSHLSQYVSELGAVGASHRKVFSYGGLLLSGLLTVVFALGMYLLARPRPWFVASSVLVALAGLGRLAAGVFPCDEGCAMNDMSFPATFHALAGFIALTGGAFAPLILAMGLRGRRQRKLFSLSVGLGGASLLLVPILFGLGKALPYVGVIQRLILAAFYMWVVAVALNADVLRGPTTDVERTS